LAFEEGTFQNRVCFQGSAAIKWSTVRTRPVAFDPKQNSACSRKHLKFQCLVIAAAHPLSHVAGNLQTYLRKGFLLLGRHHFCNGPFRIMRRLNLPERGLFVRRSTNMNPKDSHEFVLVSP
jgi:hypothetical protein